MSQLQTLLASTNHALSVLRKTVEHVEAQLDREADLVAQLAARVEQTRGTLAAPDADVETRLGAVEAALSETATGVAVGLAEASSRAEQLSSEVERLLADFQHDIDALCEVSQQLETEAVSHHQLALAGLDTLSEHAAEVTAALDSQLESLVGDVTHASEAVASSVAGLETEFHGFASELDAYQHEVDEQLEALGGRVEDLVHQAGDKTTELEHLIQETLRTSTERIQHEVHDGPMHALTEAAQHVHKSLGHVSERAQMGTAAIDSKAGELLHEMEGIVKLVEQVKPALDLVHQMLG